MSTQHKRPGRSAKRRRQERALVRLEHEYSSYPYLNERFEIEIAVLRKRISQPLLPVPAKQAKRAKG